MSKRFTSLHMRRIPRHVKDMFKATCARRGDSMEDVINALMKKYTTEPDTIKVVRSTRRPAFSDHRLEA